MMYQIIREGIHEDINIIKVQQRESVFMRPNYHK